MLKQNQNQSFWLFRMNDHERSADMNMPTPCVIETNGLSKIYKNIQALQSLDLKVQQNSIFGFLGPNGAGKTTTINMLTGLARLDEGTIHIGGIDCTRNPKAAQHLVGDPAGREKADPLGSIPGHPELRIVPAKLLLEGAGLPGLRKRGCREGRDLGNVGAAGARDFNHGAP